MIKSKALPVLAILGSAGFLMALGAQGDDEIRRHGIFIDTLDVSLVNVEVTATRDGEPVTDLSAEDFEILDDGEPVEITNFFRVDAGLRVTTSVMAPAVAPGTAEDTAVANQGEETGEEMTAIRERALVVVLVDHVFLAPSSRARVFHELRQRLDELMVDGTQVLVASKDREIRLIQRPTTDRTEIEAALDELGKVNIRNMSTEVRMTVRRIERGLNLSDLGPQTRIDVVEGDAAHTYGLARGLSQEVSHEVTHSLRLLNGFVGSLAGVPGRKAVLFVCDRLPVRPGELAWNVWVEKYGEDFGRQFGVNSVESVVQEFDTTPQIKDFIADAAASRVAFYPVGAGPTVGMSAISAENASSAVTASVVLESTDTGDGLRMLAGQTGGQTATGTGSSNWLFDRLRQDLTHYYSLAYASPHRGDGKRHRVRVRSRVPGVKLHYLESYRDKSSSQEMSDRTLASLMLDTASNPLDVRVTPGRAKKQKGGHYLMDMEVRFPISKLVLLPQEESHVGKVSIVLIVRDQKGRLSEPVRVLVPINVPHEGILQALSQTAVYNTQLAIRGGEQTVAVGVQDDIGGSNSTVNVDVDVGGSRG